MPVRHYGQAGLLEHLPNHALLQGLPQLQGAPGE